MIPRNGVEKGDLSVPSKWRQRSAKMQKKIWIFTESRYHSKDYILLLEEEMYV